MQASSHLGLQATLDQAPQLLADFERKTATAHYETKGVLFSEVFFLQAALAGLAPRRIFESGRARGVSTYLLATCFPDTEIISIEFDRNSPDVPIAQANLAPFKNVQCLFGDAQKMLPEMVRPGDAVVIDGPKHYRALRLAIRLLHHQKPAAIFLHDCYVGSCERDFLSKHVPEAFFSDDATFVRLYGRLDEKCWLHLRQEFGNDLQLPHKLPHQCAGPASSYGPTFGCIPGNARIHFVGLMFGLFLASRKERVQRTLEKLTGRARS